MATIPEATKDLEKIMQDNALLRDALAPIHQCLLNNSHISKVNSQLKTRLLTIDTRNVEANNKIAVLESLVEIYKRKLKEGREGLSDVAKRLREVTVSLKSPTATEQALTVPSRALIKRSASSSAMDYSDGFRVAKRKA